MDQSEFLGNGKHLKVLTEALSAGNINLWNAWAQGRGSGFSADLRGINLQGQDLRGALLTKARLQGAHLENADLRGARLEGAVLEGAFLSGAKLENTAKKVKVVARKGRLSPAPEGAGSHDPAGPDPLPFTHEEAAQWRRRQLLEKEEAAKKLLEERAQNAAARERELQRRQAKPGPQLARDDRRDDDRDD